jgi:hypothetical protein
MGQGPLTASAVIRFLQELEERAEAYYRQLAARHPEAEATFERCADVCGKNHILVGRTYQETISDALEAGFAFEGLELGPYAGVPNAEAQADRAAAVDAALELEDRARRCYIDVATRAESLLATIPRALRRAARNHSRNQTALENLAEE